MNTSTSKAVERAKLAAVIVCGVVIAAVVALALTSAKEAAPQKERRVVERPVSARKVAGTKAAPHRRVRQAELTLKEQATLVAARYFEQQGTYTGDKRAYRRRVGRLLLDGPQGVRAISGMEKARTVATAADVRYANEMEAVVFVSGTRRSGGKEYVENLDVTLVMDRGRYLVRSAWTPHAGY